MGRAGVESPVMEHATEMESCLCTADTSGQKPRRTQCTAEFSGEIK